ncbi:MAG TPA: DUF3806 domain-containing protein [Gammaproteobacteria bacterium]|nr:DUF3806 domain-containing protein [Gammaproteobacteria bacterium]
MKRGSPSHPIAWRSTRRCARPDLVLFARSELELELDWSDASVRAVEELAGSLHADVRRRRAAPEEVAPLVTMIGSYLGEVLRRNHGADWGWVSVNGRRVLGLRAHATGALFTPVETVRRRVHQGAASNLWRTYRMKAGL